MGVGGGGGVNQIQLYVLAGFFSYILLDTE